jgi:very-short-patch-repair endonuclease
MSRARRAIDPQYRANETPLLVGIVNRVKDWRLIETEHWYRIPVRTAPGSLQEMKYLAFYRTSAFGAEKWSVSHYARVAGITGLLRRELLPDEPRHRRADEEYYCLALGELQQLPRPILSRRWRRIVFIPTTLEKLLKAEGINDLYHGSPLEDRLHDALRGAGLEAERQFYVRETDNGYMLDFAVFCRNGRLDVECDGERYHLGREAARRDRTRDNELVVAGWRVLRFSGSEIARNLEECIRVIRRVVRRLGGLADE